MAQKKQTLFQWNRKTAPLNVGRHAKKKSSIKDWIQRVQDASEDAIQEVFGGEILGPETLKEIIPDDEAVYEAQQLLDGWMKETSFPNLHKELDYKDENWSSTTGLLLHDEPHLYSDYNDNMTFNDLQNKYLGEDTINIDYGIDISHRKGDPSDHFLSLHDNDDEDDIDDALLVQDVLHGMLTKDFTKNIDLGMKPIGKIAKNPVPKMDIRHEQVKLKGEKRRKKNITKKKEKLTQEEIAQKARERIVLEERQRIQKESSEEKAILTEMEKIKIELAEEKQRREEKVQRKKKILDEAKLQMQVELRKEREEDMRRKKEKEEARRQIQKEIEDEVVQELRMHMKILHKYFSAWYNVVLERRLNMGRAQAIADWKCKVRAWNAWKAYVACVKSNQEARAIEQAMKEKYRKEQMSIHHSNKTLLRKCFGPWLRYTHYKAEKKFLMFEHEEKKKKMALFLEAASKGDLWEKKSPEELKKQKCEVNSKTHLFETEDALEVDQFKEQGISNKKSETELLKNKAPSLQKKPPNKAHHSRTKHKPSSKQMAQFDKKDVNEDLCMEPIKANTFKDNAQVKRAGTTSAGEKLKLQSRNKDNEDISHIQNKEENDGGTSKGRYTSDYYSNMNERSRDMGGKLLTDRSDISSLPSEVSSIVSRKPQIRSEKQITKPLHLAMEERQKERHKRKVAIEEERRKKEEERLEVLRAKEAERLRQEQIEKDEKLRQKQEQKKSEALKQKEKELQIQQLRVKNAMAKDHYQKVLLRKYGLEPLTRLLQVARLNIQISDKYHNSLLARLCFVEWHVYVKEISSAKREKADQWYKQILLKRTFRSWLKCRFHLQNMNKIARTFSLSRIRKRAFNAWQDYVTDERILMWAKESSAEEHDTTRMVTKCLKAWVRFVKLGKEEREREHRKDEFRKKVQSWLPDYKGGFDMTPS